MGASGSSTWRVRFVCGLGAVAVWWGAVVDSGQIRLVVGAASERWDDVVNSVGSGSLADVTDASVAAQHTSAEALPIRWQWCAAVSGHTRIVPRNGVPPVRQVVIG